MLTSNGCERRQERLLRRMEAGRLDLFATANYRTVYYLTGSLSSADAPAVFAIWQDGHSVLITSAAGQAVATETLLLETYSTEKVIDQPVSDAAELLMGRLSARAGFSTAGVERWATPALIEEAVRDVSPEVTVLDAGPLIRELRKRKEEDEIDEIRGSLRLIASAYGAARETIAVGRTELDVYNAMQAAMVLEAGTFVQLHGDFAVGERAIRGGGPPTSRVIAENDLYILDLFPAPHLYFGDTCRTFAASAPTDAQMRAWKLVQKAVLVGEQAVKPGVRARDVFAAVKEVLDSDPLAENSFWHHAGHGIGHHGHEAPRIIPGSDDVFEVGDVITLEPGVYTKALHGGIRLEDNYVVRESGIENLFVYPREL
jgi:Xaa-Pro aminopeptidase